MIIRVSYKDYWLDIETKNFNTIKDLEDWIIKAENDIKKAERNEPL